MMTVMLCILVGIGSNFDNFTFQSVYGQREHRSPWLFYYAVTLISALSVIVGGMTALRTSSVMPMTTRYVVGSVILICVGGWSIVQAWLPLSFSVAGDVQRAKERPGRDVPFGFSDMMFVGLANSLTALTVGFGVGFINLSLTTSALSVGVFSFLFLTVPIWFGWSPRPRKWGKHVILFCSALLIITALQW